MWALLRRTALRKESSAAVFRWLMQVLSLLHFFTNWPNSSRNQCQPETGRSRPQNAQRLRRGAYALCLGCVSSRLQGGIGGFQVFRRFFRPTTVSPFSFLFLCVIYRLACKIYLQAKLKRISWFSFERHYLTWVFSPGVPFQFMDTVLRPPGIFPFLFPLAFVEIAFRFCHPMRVHFSRLIPIINVVFHVSAAS